MRFFQMTLLATLVCGVAAGQSRDAVIDFGVRGGNGFSEPPVYFSSNHYFPPSFQGEKFPYTLGPTIGVLLYDRVEVRFEAVRKRIGYQSHSGLPPAAGITWVGTTRGHSWTYPLLGTYHFSSEPVRPFAGGGLSLGGKTITTTRSTGTQTTLTPSGPVTVSTSATSSGRTPTPSAYYITGGIEGRTAFLTIRPELRFTRWSFYRASVDDLYLNSPNQFELLIGITAHPFMKK